MTVEDLLRRMEQLEQRLNALEAATYPPTPYSKMYVINMTKKAALSLGDYMQPEILTYPPVHQRDVASVSLRSNFELEPIRFYSSRSDFPHWYWPSMNQNFPKQEP